MRPIDAKADRDANQPIEHEMARAARARDGALPPAGIDEDARPELTARGRVLDQRHDPVILMAGSRIPSDAPEDIHAGPLRLAGQPRVERPPIHVPATAQRREDESVLLDPGVAPRRARDGGLEYRTRWERLPHTPHL